MLRFSYQEEVLVNSLMRRPSYYWYDQGLHGCALAAYMQNELGNQTIQLLRPIIQQVKTVVIETIRARMKEALRGLVEGIMRNLCSENAAVTVAMALAMIQQGIRQLFHSTLTEIIQEATIAAAAAIAITAIIIMILVIIAVIVVIVIIILVLPEILAALGIGGTAAGTVATGSTIGAATTGATVTGTAIGTTSTGGTAVIIALSQASASTTVVSIRYSGYC